MEAEIAFIIPPCYDRHLPPLGTPAIAGFLKAQGVTVIQEDMNIPYFESAGASLSEKEITGRKISDKVYYSDMLASPFEIPVGAYEFERPFAASYAFAERMLSSPHLKRFIADGEENPFVRFFREKFPAELLHIPLIGISVTSPSQVIATLTFGYLIKERSPGTRIVLGGQWVSLYFRELLKRSDFKAYYDYLILFEGETPLLCLIEHLCGKRDAREVPNLMYWHKGKGRLSGKFGCEDLKQLPPPDFSNLPLKEYSRSKEIFSLTFETSRGCYWGKCIFCSDYPFPKFPYREKPVELVIRDVEELIGKYGVKRLVISNTVFSPSQMGAFSEILLKRGIAIKWWAMARLDGKLDRKTLECVRESGCDMLGFGLESISQRVLDFIEKGTKREVIMRILRDCGEIGLPIFLQVMTGLPSETTGEALQTIGFVSKSEIPSVFNVFYITPGSPVFRAPENYGVEIIRDESLPFKYFQTIRSSAGTLDSLNARKMVRALRQGHSLKMPL